jgi:molybdopterin molybdotransferase
MILFEKAYEVVMQYALPLGTEQVGLTELLNRVIAADIVSDMDMPPFNKSAMDGYACRREDLSGILTVVEQIPAGKIPKKKISRNQCAEIMTGAMVPEGADCVIIVEQTEQVDADTIRFTGEKTEDNICYRGEDIRKSDVVLKKGTRIQPQQVAIMASVGVVHPTVYRRPLVGIISTGDELVEPEISPAHSQIRNSNAYQLIAQVTSTGAIPGYEGIAADTSESTREKIEKALDKNDVILLTGGVSMGEYDLVPDIMTSLGIEQKFQRIAIQPGKPTIFGVKGKKLCFGLPGNPVSSFVLFELLVKPLLFGLMGHHYSPINVILPMAVGYKRKRSVRQSWFPVRINQNGEVEPIDYHGSAHIYSLNEATGMVSIPIGETFLRKGKKVGVRLI